MNLRRDDAGDRLVILDLTSMVDLVFLLIIFFLTTSTFIDRNRENLVLPDDATERRDNLRPPGRTAIVANLTRNGTIKVSGEELSFDQLFERIANELVLVGGDAKRLDLLLRVDEDASLKHVNRIASRLHSIGVLQLKIATRLVPQEEGGEP